MKLFVWTVDKYDYIYILAENLENARKLYIEENSESCNIFNIFQEPSEIIDKEYCMRIEY